MGTTEKVKEPRPWLCVQGIPSQTGKSNVALREGWQDISDILWQFFSRKHMPIFKSKLIIIKKKWEILRNFGQFLVIFGNFGKVWAIFGNFWQF